METTLYPFPKGANFACPTSFEALIPLRSGALFGLPDEELAKRGIVRMTVDSPTFPCRISLTDRAIGENVLLLNHVSHDVANPYRATHAIFVTEG